MSFIKNHWTWIIGGIISGAMIFARLSMAVETNSRDIIDLRAQVVQNHDFITRQDEINKRLIRWLEKHER